jgi:mannitol-specific phosphotransferase system IIBC component
MSHVTGDDMTSTVEDTARASRVSRVRPAIQRFGGQLAAMVLPNVGVFITWGLLTALFAPGGWWPNPAIAHLITPMVTFLLPILLGHTGGRLVHGQRGAVATAGIAIGSNLPLFFGAMIVGPLAGYLLRAFDPGPGLGILLGVLLFGQRSLRGSVPGAIVIQFFGGIHEIYFLYVLARPRMVLAAIAGGSAGVLTFVITGAGTIATPSPGSIFAVLAVTPKGGYVGVVAGVVVAALTSFALASLLLGFGYTEHRRAKKFAAEETDRAYSTVEDDSEHDRSRGGQEGHHRL